MKLKPQFEEMNPCITDLEVYQSPYYNLGVVWVMSMKILYLPPNMLLSDLPKNSLSLLKLEMEYPVRQYLMIIPNEINNFDKELEENLPNHLMKKKDIIEKEVKKMLKKKMRKEV